MFYKKTLGLFLLIFTSFSFLTGESESNHFEFSADFNGAYDFESDYISSEDESHYAPITGSYSTIEAALSLNASYIIPKAKTNLTFSFQITPLSLMPSVSAKYTPFPFLVLGAGLMGGSGWNLGSIKGFAEYDAESASYEDLTFMRHFYYQAYAKNSAGTAYGEVRSFKMAIVPVVTTLAPTNVLAETATLNGRIDVVGDPAYKERGFVYSKSFNMPTVDDPANATTKVPVSGQNKEFSANVASLTEHSTYYVRAYATYEGGTSYGEVKTFKPAALLPVVTTLEATNILATSAILNARIDNAGEPAYTERGFLYSISYPIPTINDPSTATTKVVVDGTSKEYSANISSLKEGTTYYARAYATSSKGTSYGEVLTFKPIAVLPSVTTLEPSNVQTTTATLNGRIDKVGEPAYTERGFVYSTSYQTPTVKDPSSATTKVVVDGSSSNYSANVSSLTENATYYVRAYATSEYGTAYGEVLTFKPEHPDYVIIDNLMVQKEDLGKVNWNDANSLCNNSCVAGYSDWRLPTKNELAMMYNARDEIPNLKSENYWSSERWSPYYSDYYYINFKTGSISTQTSTFTYNVRAVRTKESK